MRRYNLIYTVNTVIEGLENATTLAQADRNRLKVRRYSSERIYISI
jgi:hypothetical protein